MRSFCINRRWGIESKAFEKSNRIVTFNSSIANLMSSVTTAGAVSVEWPRRLQDCRGSSRLFCSKNIDSWLKASLSRIFDCSGSMAMGLGSEMVRGVGVFNETFFPVDGKS